MSNQQNLADLLDAYMKKASVGDARLATLVNSIADNPYFIHRSTIRNWRVGSSKKINNWRQLVTLAIALRLDETEAETLLEAGGCPSIQTLRASAKEDDRTLLGFWQQIPVQTIEPSTEQAGKPAIESALKPATDPAVEQGRVVASESVNTLAVSHDALLRNPARPARGKFWMMTCVAALAITGVAAILLISSGYLQPAFSKASLKSRFGKDVVIPVIRDVKLGKQCLIDLALQPTGAVWGHGVKPDNCPELVIFHQYGEYKSDDLLPWNEGLAECYVEKNLERLWLGFDLPGGGEGWLRLSWFATGTPRFKEKEPITPVLWSAPEPDSEAIGAYSYEDLAGKASKLLLDFPQELDPALAFENGDFHLAGCWQSADRDRYKGIHFYWPHNTEL